MPKYLGQVVAIEHDVRKRAARKLTEAHHALQARQMLEGITREYQPRFEEGEQLPPEGVRVQVTVNEMIEATEQALIELFDITAARDFTNGPGNSGAVADVRVGDSVLVEKAPVPFLLWLDRQLDDLSTFINKLPTHDPSTEWDLEEPRGVYKSTPVQTARQVNQPKSFITVAETDRHPAQYQLVNEPVMAGTWTTIRYTGSIPVSQKARMQQRLATLRKAVTAAREEANRVEAVEPRVGVPIMSYIFA